MTSARVFCNACASYPNPKYHEDDNDNVTTANSISCQNFISSSVPPILFPLPWIAFHTKEHRGASSPSPRIRARRHRITTILNVFNLCIMFLNFSFSSRFGTCPKSNHYSQSQRTKTQTNSTTPPHHRRPSLHCHVDTSNNTFHPLQSSLISLGDSGWNGSGSGRDLYPYPVVVCEQCFRSLCDFVLSSSQSRVLSIIYGWTKNFVLDCSRVACVDKHAIDMSDSVASESKSESKSKSESNSNLNLGNGNDHDNDDFKSAFFTYQAYTHFAKEVDAVVLGSNTIPYPNLFLDFSILNPVAIPLPYDTDLGPVPRVPAYVKFSAGGYFHEPRGVPVIPLVASKVALPKSLSSVSLLDLLPDEVARVYSDPTKLLLPLPLHLPQQNENKTAGTRTSSSYPTPGGSRSEYLKLLTRLKSLSMIDFTDAPKAVNGVFGVVKDVTMIRLIIDAQPANALFLDPPKVQLPTPSTVSRLYSPAKYKLWVAKLDLESFYHQLQVPQWIRPYLALPPVTTSELVEYGILSLDECRGKVPLIFPMCTSLPMGWSHAVFLAQCVHENVLYRSSQSLSGSGSGSRPAFTFTFPFEFSPYDNILFVSSPVVDRCLHAVVIDDLIIFGKDREEVRIAHENAKERYEKAKLMVKQSKVVPPTNGTAAILGMEINCLKKTLSISPEKALSLIEHTFLILSKREIEVSQMECLVGRWLWALLIRRPALSILRVVYAFIGNLRSRSVSRPESKNLELWPSVKRELIMLIAALPTLKICFSMSWNSNLVATDASSLGGAVVSTKLTQDIFDIVWPMTGSKHSLFYGMEDVRKLLGHGPINDVDDNDWGINDTTHGMGIDTILMQPSLCFHVKSDKKSPMLPLQHLSPEVYSTFSQNSTMAREYIDWLNMNKDQWKTWIKTKWRYDAHINTTELQAIVLALRRLVSSPHGIDNRVILLSDSAVVSFSLHKGRSSKSSLINGMRKVMALQLVSGIVLHIAWVPSSFNPADKPSRDLDSHSHSHMNASMDMDS